MRIIAGQAKGRHLKGPKGLDTRPTSDKVRGAIFDMIESLLETRRAAIDPEAQEGESSGWEGVAVLDLYAGTGALGIEALSRGANSAEFVEVNPQACRVVRQNLADTGLATKGMVHCARVRQVAERLAASGRQFDLVLADPPYAEPGIEELILRLDSAGMVREGGWLVIEHSYRRSLPDETPSLSRVKLRRHGDTDISIYERHRPEALSTATHEGAGT